MLKPLSRKEDPVQALRGCTWGKIRGLCWMCCFTINECMQMWETQHEQKLKENLSGEKHLRENKDMHLFAFSSFLKVWQHRPPSFDFCQPYFITWSCTGSDKDSVLAFIGVVVCSCSPLWSCCQGVSCCFMTGTLTLKSNMTDLMAGQFPIPLSYAVWLFTT